MSVSTLRLLYAVDNAPVKEVIKEFFRLIGCLFYDVPVRSVPDAEKELRTDSGAEIDIVLNLDVFQWRKVLPSPDDDVPIYVEQVRLKGRESLVVLVECKFPIDDEAIRDEEVGGSLKREFYKEMIEVIIKKIWGGTEAGKQILKIKDLFFEQDLLGSLQCKRALCVINMGEVLELNLTPQKIHPSEYVGKMLSAFNGFYNELMYRYPDGERDGVVSVYVRYARVNIARKIREVFSLLDALPIVNKEENGSFPSVTYCSADYLLAELGKLQRDDQQYLGTLFLAAHVCQSEPSQELNAAFYYQQLFAVVSDREPKIYSFAYYEYGRYLEKIKKDWELAVRYYTKAKELDPFSYRAYFKLACHEVKNRNFSAAKGLFGKVIRIIGETYSGASEPEQIEWKYLSLRCIQYLFKSYVWLWKIALTRCEYGLAATYLKQAGIVAEKYKENACLREVYDNESIQWKDLEEYHKDSDPVRLLYKIVEEGYRTVMDDFSSKVKA